MDIMKRSALLISLLLLFLFSTAFGRPRPELALALLEGRTFDQAHDSGYIDWSGPVDYVALTHRDGTYLPPEEGGGDCGAGCTEWVTRVDSGGTVSGSFAGTVNYFEVMISFSHDPGSGTSTLQACSATQVDYTYTGYGKGLPGFLSIGVAVPAGCSNWSLSSSGGYVDFRAVDVGYASIPPTATSTFTALPTATWTGIPTRTSTITLTPSSTLTPTSTRTPTSTFTFTSTATSTVTFTPTATNTYTVTATSTFTPTATSTFTATSTMTFTPTSTSTPTATNTPLPPMVHDQVICDLWGDDGWCRGKASLEISASDPQGYAVSISGELAGKPFACGDACVLSLPEGVGLANFTALSSSGRTANGTSTWKVDGTPPLLQLMTPPVDGKHGWYVTAVDLSAVVTDAHSGVRNVQASIDTGKTWKSLPLHLADGIHEVVVKARDVAGNETVIREEFRIDTIPPVSTIQESLEETVVQEMVVLSGKVDDSTSGPAGGEFSFDGGATWQRVTVDESGNWSLHWEIQEIPNGPKTLLFRGEDEAGNIGAPGTLQVQGNHLPPSVSLTRRWWIWETGALRVFPHTFPVESVRLTIRDGQNRWPAVVLDFDPSDLPAEISWNRLFRDGTLAPPGDYQVDVVACDIRVLCGRASGIIVIPLPLTVTVTQTSVPTATPTFTPVPTAFATNAVLLTVIPVTFHPEEPPVVGDLDKRTPFSWWALFGLVGLMFVIASASVVDPRPQAIWRLVDVSNQIKKTSRADIYQGEE